MGFRQGAYATVWDVEQKSDTVTRGRISISRKNKDSGNYEQDFGGFVAFVGSAAAQKAAKLREKDRIKLGDVDVSNKYDKESGKTYTNFTIFNFEIQGDISEDSFSTEPERSEDSFAAIEEDLPF